MFTIELENSLSADEFIDVLKRSTLAARRPVENFKQIESMLQHADVIVTARRSVDQRLVGVSRAITDFSYCTYLSDLAVDQDFQNQGLGRLLIDATHREAGASTNLILLAAPASEKYYPHVGFQAHKSCWVMPGRPID